MVPVLDTSICVEALALTFQLQAEYLTLGLVLTPDGGFSDTGTTVMMSTPNLQVLSRVLNFSVSKTAISVMILACIFRVPDNQH